MSDRIRQHVYPFVGRAEMLSKIAALVAANSQFAVAPHPQDKSSPQDGWVLSHPDPATSQPAVAA